jgi:hypothetical protein
MLGLTHGELFVVVFVTLAVVSARYWPMAGEAVAARLARRRTQSAEKGKGNP